MENIDKFFFERVIKMKQTIFTFFIKKKKKNLDELIEDELGKNKNVIGEPPEIRDLYAKYINILINCSIIFKLRDKKTQNEKILEIIEDFPQIFIPSTIDTIINHISENSQKVRTYEDKNICDFLFSGVYVLYDQKILYSIYDEKENKGVKKEITIITELYPDKNVLSDIISNIDDNIFVHLFQTYFKKKIDNYNHDNFMDILLTNKVIIPITREFNRIHNSNLKTQTSKKVSRSTQIINNYYSAVEEDPEIFVKHLKHYGIYYNKLEEINILNKFVTYDGIFIKNIDNKDSYKELKKIHNTRYFNFRNNKFTYLAQSKIVSFRLPRNGFNLKNIETRNINKGEVIDIHGYVLNDYNKSYNHHNIEISDTINTDINDILYDRKSSKKYAYIFEKNDIINDVIVFKTIFNNLRNFYIKLIETGISENDSSVNDDCSTKILHDNAYLFTDKEINVLKIIISKNKNTHKKNREIRNTHREISKTQTHKFVINPRDIDALYQCVDVIKLYHGKKQIQNDIIERKKGSYSKCIHLLEMEYIEDRKLDKNFNYANSKNLILTKYAIRDSDLGYVCRLCSQIIESEFFYEEPYNSDSQFISVVEGISEKHDEDNKIIYNLLETKLSSILRYPFLSNKASNYTRVVVSDLFYLLTKHNSFVKRYEDMNLLPIIDFDKSLYIEADTKQKNIILCYVNVILICGFTKKDFYRILNIDSLSSKKNFLKTTSFINKMLKVHNFEDKIPESLYYSVFILSCVQAKYILRIRDKHALSNEIQTFMKNTLKILFTWLKYDHSDKDKCLGKHISLLKYKMQFVFKDSVEDKTYIPKNYNLPVADTYCINSEFLKNKNITRVMETRNICIKKNNIIERKGLTFDDIKKKPYEISPSLLTNPKKHLRKICSGIEFQTHDHSFQSTSITDFLKTLNIEDNDNTYSINFNLKGEVSKVEFMVYGKNLAYVEFGGKTYISIFLMKYRSYMFFSIRLKSYKGYSLKNDISLMIPYKGSPVFLKTNYSTKNKIKFIGFDQELFFIPDNKIENILNIFNNTERNIRSICEEIHIIFIVIQNKNMTMIQGMTDKMQKIVMAILRDSENTFTYNNEMNISFLSHKYKINDSKVKDKYVIFSMEEIYFLNSFPNIHTQYVLAGLSSVYKQNKNKATKALILNLINYMFSKYLIVDANSSIYLWENEFELSIDFIEGQENQDAIQVDDSYKDKEVEGDDDVDVDDELFDRDGDDQEVLYNID